MAAAHLKLTLTAPNLHAQVCFCVRFLIELGVHNKFDVDYHAICTSDIEELSKTAPPCL